MIHHHGASLSKKQTADLLLCLIAHSRIKYKHHICQPFPQPGQLMWLHMNGLSFTLVQESWAKFYECRLCMVCYLKWPWAVNHRPYKICTACEWQLEKVTSSPRMWTWFSLYTDFNLSWEGRAGIVWYCIVLLSIASNHLLLVSPTSKARLFSFHLH